MVQINIPDPDYSNSEKAKRNFEFAVKLAAIVVAVIWLVFLVDGYLGLGLRQFGLVPRQISGLAGIIMVPLLHANFPHIISNSLPLFVGLSAMLYLYPNSAVKALPVLYFGTSMLTWIYARPNLHIGASGLIYGILTYVFVSGLLRRDLRSIGVTLLVYFLYGSMVWGVLPIREKMSWELHLSGVVLGVLLALRFRHWDHVRIKEYDWEENDEIPDWYKEEEKKDSNTTWEE
jgi:membrane associated rhomboid family serine protease